MSKTEEVKKMLTKIEELQKEINNNIIKSLNDSINIKKSQKN